MFIEHLSKIPAAYFNAVGICFFVQSYRLHGLIMKPVQGMKESWLLFRAMLFGFVPVVLLGFVVMAFVPAEREILLISGSIGAFICSALVHRTILGRAEHHTKWNWAIGILVLAQLIAYGIWFLFSGPLFKQT